MTKKYKFESAHDWLNKKINQLEAGEDVKELAQMFRSIADKIDGDEIQDVFESDMKDDGFFKPIIDVGKLDRETCVRLLEGACIQCYDHESLEELREAVLENIDDGTIDPDDIEAE